MSHAAQLLTAEQLQRLPDDDSKYELVQGRLIRMSPVGWPHGVIVIRFAAALLHHVEAHQLGAVVAEVGFILARAPDTVRAPDVAFVRRDRIPSRQGFVQGPPDLAVEVLSPEDRRADVLAKVDDYLTHGVAVVLVIDPDAETIRVCRRLTPSILLGIHDALNLGDVVDGFRCSVRELFGESFDR